MVDPDEFISPRYVSIRQYLDLLPNSGSRDSGGTINEIRVPAIRYGTSGTKIDIKGTIIFDANKGTSNLVNYDDGVQLSMVMLTNPNRAPSQLLDPEFEHEYNKTCLIHDYPAGCSHEGGKSIWRTQYCALAGVHYCELLTTGKSLEVSLKKLRLNHYAFRSAEHVEGLLDLIKSKKKAAYDNFDMVWFSHIYDPMPLRIANRLKSTLLHFLQKSV